MAELGENGAEFTLDDFHSMGDPMRELNDAEAAAAADGGQLVIDPPPYETNEKPLDFDGADAPADAPPAVDGDEKPADGEQDPAKEPAKEGEEDPDAEKTPDPAKEPEPEKKPEEKVPQVFAVPEKLKAIMPEVSTQEQFEETVLALENRRRAEEDANMEMVNFLNSQPIAKAILKDLRNTNLPIFAIIRKHLELGENESIPDPGEDPVAYKAYADRVLSVENQRRADEAEAQRRATLMEAAGKKAVQMKQKFQTAHNLSDADMQEFMQWNYNTQHGNPETFELPEDYLERMWLAKTYKADITAAQQKIVEAEKKGRIEGANAAIDQLKHGGRTRGDSIPAVRPGGSPKAIVVDQNSDLERSLSSKTNDIFNV